MRFVRERRENAASPPPFQGSRSSCTLRGGASSSSPGVLLQELLHPPLGGVEVSLAQAGEADPLLEGRQRLGEGQLPLLQALDQLLEAPEELLEGDRLVLLGALFP